MSKKIDSIYLLAVFLFVAFVVVGIIGVTEHSKTVAGISFTLLFGTLFVGLEARILAKAFLFTPFENTYEISPDVKNAELKPRIQMKVNEHLVGAARSLQVWYDQQEVIRQKIKGCNNSRIMIEDLDAELSATNTAIEEAKIKFYTARDIAVEEGFIAFESYKYYLSEATVALCLDPSSEWYGRVPCLWSGNEKGGYKLSGSAFEDFLRQRIEEAVTT